MTGRRMTGRVVLVYAVAAALALTAVALWVFVFDPSTNGTADRAEYARSVVGHAGVPASVRPGPSWEVPDR